tara:strand:- start:536 stop:724 length:189 start_codon:yes stop_codon:yes gene_type:complete
LASTHASYISRWDLGRQKALLSDGKAVGKDPLKRLKNNKMPPDKGWEKNTGKYQHQLLLRKQ